MTQIDGFKQSLEKGDRNTVDELLPLLKPGEYQFVYLARFTAYVHKVPKLALRFRIVTQGEYFGIELERWYNCKRLIGKPGKNGEFVPPKNGGFLHEYCTVFPQALTRQTRLERISFKPFVNSVITGEVKTVKRDSQQREKPTALQYSTIKQLIRAGA